MGPSAQLQEVNRLREESGEIGAIRSEDGSVEVSLKSGDTS